MSMSNPFTRIRKRARMSQPAFARTLGVSLSTVAFAESGTPCEPTKLVDALANVGYDRGKLLAEYQAWRAESAHDAAALLRIETEAANA